MTCMPSLYDALFEASFAPGAVLPFLDRAWFGGVEKFPSCHRLLMSGFGDVPSALSRYGMAALKVKVGLAVIPTLLVADDQPEWREGLLWKLGFVVPLSFTGGCLSLILTGEKSEGRNLLVPFPGPNLPPSDGPPSDGPSASGAADVEDDRFEFWHDYRARLKRKRSPLRVTLPTAMPDRYWL